MLSEADMKERQEFDEARQARARTLYGKITETLQAGGMVQVCTYTHAKEYTAKHADMFRLGNGSVYVQRGKHWDCIDYCGFRFYRPAA